MQVAQTCGTEELVHRLTACAEYAKVHVNVLEDMPHTGSEDLRGTDVSRTLKIKRLDWPMYWRICSFIVAKISADFNHARSNTIMVFVTREGRAKN
jgi:hypothetical protein